MIGTQVVYNLGLLENQDGGVGRHTAPPRTTITDRIEQQGVRHHGNKK